MAKDSIFFEIRITSKGGQKVIKETIDLNKKQVKLAKSTDKLSKKTDRYNRLQKGTAQMGMNTTKSFSKMQQNIDGGGGAGGLVRAYALLAANVFALTAAFGVLSRSAQIDTLIESMEVLSTSGGIYIKNLARDMQEASGYGIDLAQAFSQVSLAASAGLSTKEIEGLTMVAKGAAISLGRNLPDAMDRIFRGAIKLEPEILDEIGLFVRVDEAAQKYARNNNKVVSALTQVEKRQAFLNEILEQGTRKFQEYADTIKPDPYVRLGAALGDIAQEGLSLLNNVLGPTLGFLAQSKTLLTIVFGALVITLLKKAVPAMGIMTKTSAELATQRAKDAKAYSTQITETSKKELESNRERLRDSRKIQRAISRDKQLVLKVGGKDISSKLEAKLQDKTIKGKKREELIEKRILDLTKKQRLEERKKMAGYDAELSALQKELDIEKELSRLRKGGVSGVKQGSLADMRQKKLDSEARVQTVVAGAAGTMETQGITTGWRDLNKQLEIGEKQADGTFKAFTKGEKSMARLKGGVSALGVGFNKLMMIMGPIMMAFALLTPFVIAAGKALGFGSKEAKAYTDSLKKLQDQVETYDKRLKKQVEGMKSTILTYYQVIKATLAFNKNIADTTERLLDSIDALKEWQITADKLPKFWDTFTGDTKVGRKEMALMAEGSKVLTKSLAGLIDAGGMETEVGMLVGPENADAVLNYADSYERLKESMRDAGLTLGKHNEMMTESVHRVFRLALEYKDYADVVDAASIPYVTMAMAFSEQEEAFFKTALQLARTKDKMDFMGVSVDELKKKTFALNKITAHQAKLYEILVSALDGAQEAVGKFQNQFMPKTKVDDIIGSMDAMDAALDEMSKKDRVGFLQSFGDKDNPFVPMFSKIREEIKAITVEGKRWTRFVEKLNQLSWDQVKKEFAEYRTSVLKAAQETKELTNINKQLNEVIDAGGKIRDKINTNQNKIMRNSAMIADSTLKIMGRSFGLTKEQTRETTKLLVEEEKLLKNDDERTAFNKKLLEYGLDINKLLSLRGALHDVETKELNEQVHLGTKLERLEIQKLKTLAKVVAATKMATEAASKLFETNTKLAALRSFGRTTLTAKEEAEIEISAAVTKFKVSLMEAKMKRATIRAEEALLTKRLLVLALETKDFSMLQLNVKKRGSKITSEWSLQDDLKSNLTEASRIMDAAYGDIISNVWGTLTTDLSSAIGSAFGKGMVDGIIANRTAILAGIASIQKEIDEGRMDKGVGEGKQKKLSEDLQMQGIRDTIKSMSADLKELGPEGELVASVAMGALAVTDAWMNVGAVFAKVGDDIDTMAGRMEYGASIAQAVSQTLGAINQIMQANSKAQVSELDNQIKAEKTRDGKSKESLAKISMMEKKKEAMKKKAFDMNKKMLMAQTIANTAAGIMGVWAGVRDPFFSTAMAAAQTVVIAALGAAQLAVIAKTSYQGGGGTIAKPAMTALSIGKRDDRVDVSRGANRGELSYLRGERGMGQGANRFIPTGGAAGLRKGYADGGALVGERGPEVIAPMGSYQIIPNDALGGAAGNINFTINAVDAEGVEDVLLRQRGHIIEMIREAANNTGERFLESVDTDVVGVG